jgi:hypothetical protein
MSGASRRSLIAGGGLGLVLATIGGRNLWVTPSEAAERQATPKTLSETEARTLAAFAEILLPGAAKAGVVAFVDHHVSVPAAESLLMLRYLDVPPPYADFYRTGLAALDAYAKSETGSLFSELSADRGTQLVSALAQSPPPQWRGPPSPLFYFAVRADAVDVVYGTEAGFEKLGVPYMAHINPPTRW